MLLLLLLLRCTVVARQAAVRYLGCPVRLALISAIHNGTVQLSADRQTMSKSSSAVAGLMVTGGLVVDDERVVLRADRRTDERRGEPSVRLMRTIK